MKAAYLTLGCKVNSYETEGIRIAMEEHGYETVPFSKDADIFIINTCSVTNMADRKSRQMIHRARKLNPEALVVAAGCFTQANFDELVETKAADIILGNTQKSKIPELIGEYLENREGFVNPSCSDMFACREYENMSATGDRENTRAYVKIQDGCNQFCSYCIIPYVRGRIRSRNEESITEEIKRLAEIGFCEVVLTGIHLSSYGMERDGAPKSLEQNPYLIALIEEISKIDGIERIRLGSLEPRIVTEEFTRRLSKLANVCPHFHLSLQSGCDKTLAAMNRRYTAAEFFEACGILRKYFDRPAITTDMIVGFAGETEEDFKESVSFAKKCGFFMIHVFKYSRRKGTKAATMKEQVSECEKNLRSDVLMSAAAELRRNYLNTFTGETVSVLFEETETLPDGTNVFTGHTERYVKVLVPCTGQEEYEGRIKKVRAVSVTEAGEIMGELILT